MKNNIYAILMLAFFGMLFGGCVEVDEGGYYEVSHDGKPAFDTACGDRIVLSMTPETVKIVVEGPFNGSVTPSRNLLEEYTLKNDGNYSFEKKPCNKVE